MHGFLWGIHIDHHKPTKTPLEKNDLFALIFTAPSVVLIVLGYHSGPDAKFWAGIGIALYGMVYFMGHDVLIHQRLKLWKNTNSKYFKAVVKAHLDHHYGKKNYGFLFMIPWRYFREEYRSK
jgi:beta-carotene 3-hydroxylase